MNKEAMKLLILETVAEKLGSGYHGTLQKVRKTNVEVDGLIIVKDGENIAPTIYLEAFYEELENGTSIEDVVSDILRTYFQARIIPAHFDVTYIQDFKKVKNKLYVELINRHSNEELLQDVPHTQFLDDFAIIVRCVVEMASEGRASFLVHNNHLKMWQVEQEYLISHAVQNTRELFGVELVPMESFIQKICPEMAECDAFRKPPMWVMTNNRKQTGAATILFSDVLKDFANKHGNFYVIFSSVHEVLLVLTPDNSDIDSITRMNQEVNATQVAEDEILGTKAYYYCKDRGFVL